MSLDNLPPELLDSIFQFLSPSSNPFSNSNLPLYSQAYHPLTLVCKRWNEITTTRLYTAARLSRVKQFSTFSQTLESRNLGQHLRCLRLRMTEWTQDTKASLLYESSKLLKSLGSLTPNLEELYLAGTQTINFSSVFELKNLKKLVIWGARLELSSPLPTNLLFPSLTELSLCGIKNLTSLSHLFTPSIFPSLLKIALCYSQLPPSPTGENFLSPFPLSTLIVTTSNVRRSSGQEGNEMTLYTNRFYSILEGYTDFGKHSPYPRHLQMTDIEGLRYDMFVALMDEIGQEGVGWLENVWVPEGSWSNEVEKERIEEWCRDKGIALVWEVEGDYMHESLIPESFVKVCEEKRTRMKPRRK